MLSILLPLQGGHLQEGGVTWRKEARPGTGWGGVLAASSRACDVRQLPASGFSYF